MVRIDLTGEEEAGEQETAGSGPAPSQEPRLASSLRQARPEAPREASPSPELEAEGPLAEAFSRFPYPSPEELARCGRSAGLPAERVRVWFAVQRLRRGISWTPEEVREARDRLWHRPGTLRLPVPPPGLLPVPVPASPGREAQDGASGPPGGGGLKKARTSPDGADSPEALHRQPRPSPAHSERRWRKTKAQLAALKSSLARDRYPGEAERGRVQVRTSLSKADIKRCHQLRGLPISSSDRRGDTLPHSHALSPLPASQRGPALKADVRGVGEGEVVEEEEEEEEEKASGLPGAPVVTETANRALVPSPGRPRKTKEQLATLKTFFLLSQWPSGEDYSQLVEHTGLARADIIQWFGDTRYALKNGQLKWVRRGAGGLLAGQSPGADPGPGADCGPLEEYLSRHGAHPRQDDLCRLCLESRLNARQVAEWFRRRRGRGRGGRTPEAEDGGSEEDRLGQGGGDGEGSRERKEDHVVRVML
ncbi:homeobox and leucine zipper protein Homez-like [Mustelus asterias]